MDSVLSVLQLSEMHISSEICCMSGAIESKSCFKNDPRLNVGMQIDNSGVMCNFSYLIKLLCLCFIHQDIGIE
jgi:hypothetical protein